MNKMNKEKRKLLYKLLRQWTRSEVIARHGPLNHFADVGNFYDRHLKAEDEIRELLYDSSDLVALGIKWGIIEKPEDKKKRKARTKVGKHD